ncbi:MAG: Gldg family protein [Verrucomicrobiota bacterium]
MATDGPPSFTPGRRWRVGLNVLASILALLAILAMVNFLAARHSRRLQWSAHDRAQLSPVTREVLRSVTNQVKVIVFFDRTKPLFDMVADLLAQYRTECHKLELEFVDYERSLGRAKTIQTDYGLTSVADGDRIIFASGESKRVVYAKDLSEFDYKAIMRGEGEARRTGFKGEQLFTSALYSLMDTRPVTVYFLQGHREHDPSDTDDRSGYSRFAQLLSESQIAFAKLEPTALVTKEVPADCHLLVIANPVTPLHPAELANVQKYLTWEVGPGSVKPGFAARA